MYGTRNSREVSLDFYSQLANIRPSIHTRRANLTVKFQDLYGFTVEGNVDDVNVLNEVREKLRQQGRVWWSLEANKGANWYLNTRITFVSEGRSLKPSIKFSAIANAITLKKLIRMGIPPVLRPKVWFSLSGAAKKKSTVPDSYYTDLIKAVEGLATPATRQIDHIIDFFNLRVMMKEKQIILNDRTNYPRLIMKTGFVMEVIEIFLKNHTQLDVNKLIHYYGEKRDNPPHTCIMRTSNMTKMMQLICNVIGKAVDLKKFVQPEIMPSHKQDNPFLISKAIKVQQQIAFSRVVMYLHLRKISSLIGSLTGIMLDAITF